MRPPPKLTIAVIYDPFENFKPSSIRTLKHFQRLARRKNILVSLIDINHIDNHDTLWCHDALFIRCTTHPRSQVFKLVTEAESRKKFVIDDSQTIRKSCDKIFQHYLFDHKNVPHPKGTVFSSIMSARIIHDYPVVLKIPDGSFSEGIYCCRNRENLEQLSKKLFKTYTRLLIQEFIETPYDWRIGILDKEPLFASKYKMVRGHWQIIKRIDSKVKEGASESVKLSEVPFKVLEAALSASNSLGGYLHGVDVKEKLDNVYVIEVNDNPSLEYEEEDSLERNNFWYRILDTFMKYS